MRLFILSCLCSTLFAQGAYAQAFGVGQGESVSRYDGQSTGLKNQFRIKVPQPNSEFDSYVAESTPQTGICKVSGLGRTHEADSYGSEVRQAFNRIRLALKEKYGSSKDFDFLNYKSIWNEPNEYGWSLYKKERTLASFWSVDEGSEGLVNIKGIMLRAHALSPDKTYISISYEFFNFEECSVVSKQKDNSGL